VISTISTPKARQCPKRQSKLSKLQFGRTCPDECRGDWECVGGQKCLCDGICGKTCANPNLSCNKLDIKSNGVQIACTNDFKIGSKCIFTCKPGYRMSGKPNLNCQSNMKWDKSSPPKCIKTGSTTAAISPSLPVVCPKRNPGVLKLQRRTDSCPKSCSVDSDCTPPRRCNCDGACGKTCSLPGTMCRPNWNNPALKRPGRTVSCSNGNKVGSKCAFTCETGFKLLGKPNLNCQSNGRWDKARPPVCKATSPGPITSSGGPAATLQICPKKNPSLLKGRACPKSCRSNSDCTGEEKCHCDGPCGPTCSKPSIKCAPNFTIRKYPGRQVSCSRGPLVGSKCSYSCEKGFQMVGKPNMNCQSNGRWDKQRPPTCRKTSGAPTAGSQAVGTQSRPRTPPCKIQPGHNRCCKTQSYNGKTHYCCNGIVEKKTPVSNACCNEIRKYQTRSQGCCAGKLFSISNQKCQRGSIVPKI